MSTATVHAPVATARPPHRWTFRSLLRGWRPRRRGHGDVHVAIAHLADIPPT